MEYPRKDKFVLQAFEKESNREPIEGIDIALKYLLTPTSQLDRVKIDRFANELQSIDRLNPEIKYYAAWAFLDAAYPGLFSVGESPVDREDADSLDLAIKGFTFLKQLDSRATYFHIDTPTSELIKKPIDLHAIIFGIKSRIVRCFEDLMTTSPSGGTAQSIIRSQKRLSIRIAEGLRETGFQLREQIQITERIMNTGHTVHSPDSIKNFYANLRGIEAECAFLGAVWEYIGSVDPGEPMRALALPASVRTDYGLQYKEMKGDAIFYYGENKYGVEIARGKVINAKHGKNNVSAGNTIYLYGDRDLRLPSYQRIDGKFSYSPSFKGYSAEAPRVMKQMISTIDRIDKKV